MQRKPNKQLDFQVSSKDGHPHHGTQPHSAPFPTYPHSSHPQVADVTPSGWTRNVGADLLKTHARCSALVAASATAAAIAFASAKAGGASGSKPRRRNRLPRPLSLLFHTTRSRLSSLPKLLHLHFHPSHPHPSHPHINHPHLTHLRNSAAPACISSAEVHVSHHRKVYLFWAAPIQEEFTEKKWFHYGNKIKDNK